MYIFFKRLLDLFIATVALILLSPILIPICLILMFTGERDVFYLQKRVGFKNKLFDIRKFATMVKDSPNIGTGSITLRNDPRVTPIGKFLRMTKINELPQIINVLLGEMSIVGPRPLMKVSFEEYPPEVQAVIYNAKPGITGIGSIVFRDEEKLYSEATDLAEMSRKIAQYKGELEVWYQKNATILLDIQLIFLTAFTKAFALGVYSSILKGLV
jgi:lipopolysaccharide/colanic/teichoic acid biosynthesis glycosyltransferase